jgi:hypothetical protein
MMINQVYLIKLLVGFFYMALVIQLPANEPNSNVANTNLAKATIELIQPTLSSSCKVEISITGITDRPLFFSKTHHALSMSVALVGADGKPCPFTEKGEMYYGEKAMKRYWVSGILVWLKKDEPISIKMDLAEFFQLKAGNWTLEMSIPLSQIREEGAPRQDGGWVEFKGIKIEIPESKKE